SSTETIGHGRNETNRALMPLETKILRDIAKRMLQGHEFKISFNSCTHLSKGQDIVHIPVVVLEGHEFNKTDIEILILAEVHKIENFVVVYTFHDNNIEFDSLKSGFHGRIEA